MTNNIKARYKHGKYGTFMFNTCAKWTQFLMKHRWLYYLLACTWGIIMTLIGLIITAALWPISWFTKKVRFEKFHWIYCVHVGPSWWGGLEMGLMFLRDQDNSENLNCHEFGHTFQNCLFGPLFLFLVGIPSAIRYWYREIMWALKKGDKLPAYDAMWFEDAASVCGEYVINCLKNKVNVVEK